MVPRELWKKPVTLDFCVPMPPEEVGGAGGDFLFNVIVGEELCRVGASGPGFTLHSEISSFPIFYITARLRRKNAGFRR